MTAPHSEERAPATRRILDAARGLVAEGGAAQLSMGDVAARADEDVCGFDVAMNDACRVSDVQGVGDLYCEIDQRINLLTRTRNQLDQCIGCGCLSLQKCQLYNKDDRMGAKGSGPRAILG